MIPSSPIFPHEQKSLCPAEAVRGISLSPGKIPRRSLLSYPRSGPAPPFAHADDHSRPRPTQFPSMNFPRLAPEPPRGTSFFRPQTDLLRMDPTGRKKITLLYSFLSSHFLNTKRRISVRTGLFATVRKRMTTYCPDSQKHKRILFLPFPENTNGL